MLKLRNRPWPPRRYRRPAKPLPNNNQATGRDDRKAAIAGDLTALAEAVGVLTDHTKREGK